MTMTEGDFQDLLGEATIYEPANECIYCGNQTLPLSNEHTLPDGLGGRHVLPRASCPPCQAKINEFEQYCMRTLFANIRASLGLQSTKKRKRLRPPSSVMVKRKTGAKERVILGENKIPLLFALPAFPAPFFLTGEEPSETFLGGWWTYNPNSIGSVLDDLGAETVFTETIKPWMLARLIAKIAHSHCWALWGSAFEPLLVPIILGEDENFIKYIGGWVKDLPPTPNFTHTIRIMNWRAAPGVTDSYLIAEIRLFSVYAAPVYYAVVGRTLKPWPFESRRQ